MTRFFARAIPLPSFGLGAVIVNLPSLQSLWELIPPLVLAVPKKKVSHSRKSMRSANKGLEDKTSESSTEPVASNEPNAYY